ncbi:MAG: NAD-dependent epimerase/dehydratase family protein [Bacteroidota bacterium]
MILLTGSTGLLGSHVLGHLLSSDIRVIALRRSSSSVEGLKEVLGYYSEQPEALYNKVEWRTCDLNNPWSVSEAMEGATRVVHAAAMVSFDPGDRKKLVRNNVEITANLVAAALHHKVERFVHISSTAAIGRPPAGELATEDMIWAGGKGTSGYAESKFKSEMEVWRGIEEGLPAVILNPSIILGAGFRESGSGALLTRIARGMKFYTEGVTGYTGVEDVVKAIDRGLNGEDHLAGNRYIISSENLSYREVFGIMAKALGTKAPGIHASPFMTALAWRADWLGGLLPGRKRMLTRETADAAHSIIRFSNEKARKELGIEFEGIESVVERIVKLQHGQTR